jgi:hypothetical protein
VKLGDDKRDSGASTWDSPNGSRTEKVPSGIELVDIEMLRHANGSVEAGPCTNGTARIQRWSFANAWMPPQSV